MAESESVAYAGQSREDTDTPCLRLFLSIDVSGSTAFKEKHGNYSDFEEHWARFYEDFFTAFPASFKRRFFESENACPKMWKCLGDEIIYEKVVKDEEECHDLIAAFYSALFEYDDYLLKGKFAGSNLRVKGTCWTAAFPLRNSVIIILEKDAYRTTDYVGPDIDLGFRLGKATRPGRLTISMDLADLLTRKVLRDPFKLFHVGWERLKGVMGDNPYPIIWIVKGAEGPVLLPWEGYICCLTKSFEEKLQAGADTSDDIQALVLAIRKALPSFHLYTPYFELNQMPEVQKSFYSHVWLPRYLQSKEPLDSDMVDDQGE